jgi:4,5-DOPA dioxygenase extradiol
MSGNGRTRMPAVFVGHGTPLNAMRQNRWTDCWRRLGREIRRPQSILAISGHWCTRGTWVTAMPAPPTIHDFGGFPQELFDMEYPAPGDPALAERVRALLKPITVHLDYDFGLDHGTWVVLSKTHPDADVPVVQLSIDMTQPASFHYQLGRRLQPLRDEGVLILGTGNVVHNLRTRIPDQPVAHDWALRFNNRIRDAILAHDVDALIEYERMGDDARLSVPTPDHYYPLLYVVGAAGRDRASIEVDGVERGSMSMLSTLFGCKLADTTGAELADAHINIPA